MNQKLFCLVALVMLAGSASARAAVVYLTDGSQVRGTVVGATARDVQVHTPDGILRISADRIRRIDYSGDEPASAAEAPVTDTRPAASERISEPGFPMSYRTLKEVERFDHFFSVAAGLNVPTSKVNMGSAGGGKDDNGDSGGLFGLQYLYFSDPRWAFGMNLEFMNRSSAESSQLLPAAETAVSGRTMLIMPVLRYTFIDRGTVRPYLLAGVGANRTSTIIDARPTIGFAWSDTGTDETRRLVNDRHWGWASTARLGLDFNTGGPSVVSLEMGWVGVRNPRAGATFAGRDLGLDSVTGKLDILTVAGRIGWRF